MNGFALNDENIKMVKSELERRTGKTYSYKQVEEMLTEMKLQQRLINKREQELRKAEKDLVEIQEKHGFKICKTPEIFKYKALKNKGDLPKFICRSLS